MQMQNLKETFSGLKKQKQTNIAYNESRDAEIVIMITIRFIVRLLYM